MADVVVTEPARAGVGYTDWGAILGGAAVATALSFVLLTFGATIGLSLVSPYPSQSYGRFAASVAAFWALAVPILSLLAGGYVAGRMRAAWENADKDEVEFRDGVHGLLVWALSVIISAVLAFLTVSAAAQVGAEVGKAALSDRSTIVAPAVDTLLRGVPTAAATAPAKTTDTATPAPGTRPGTATRSPDADVREDVTRIIVSAVAAGELTAENKQYIVQVVSQRTGLPPADAERRVDEAFAEAARAVDTARKAAVVAGLVTAIALIVGLAAAWYAAQQGGRHRDQHVPARFGFLPWRAPPMRRSPPTTEEPRT